MDLPKFPLYVALTRPAINKIGIPQKAWMLIFGFSALFVFLYGHGRLTYWIVLAPLYVIFRSLTEWDHNFMRIGWQWIKSKWSALVYGAELSPLPVGIPSNPDDIAGVM